MPLVQRVGDALRGAVPAVQPVQRVRTPTRRVLLIGPRDTVSSVRGPLEEQLRTDAAGIDVDVVHDLRGALRVILADPLALARYDAVCGLMPNRRTGGGGAALRRIVDAAAALVPTRLLVVADPLGSKHLGSRTGAVHVAGVRVEPEPVPLSSIARGVVAALHDLLGNETAPAGRDGRGLRHRLDGIARIVRDDAGATAAQVNLLDGDRVLTVSATDGQLGVRPVTDSLCGIAARNAGTTVLLDTWLDADACRLGPTKGPRAVRFYAGHPILDRAGTAIGVLCVWSHRPRAAVDADLGLLRDLAMLAEAEIAHAG